MVNSSRTDGGRGRQDPEVMTTWARISVRWRAECDVEVGDEDLATTSRCGHAGHRVASRTAITGDPGRRTC